MTDEHRTRARHQVLVWFGVLGGAAAWAAHLGLSYLLVPTACRTGRDVLLHAVTVVTVAVAIGATMAAHRVWSEAGTDDRHDTTAERLRFLAVAGMFLSALFAALNLFEGATVFFVDACLGVGR